MKKILCLIFIFCSFSVGVSASSSNVFYDANTNFLYIQAKDYKPDEFVTITVAPYDENNNNPTIDKHYALLKEEVFDSDGNYSDNFMISDLNAGGKYHLTLTSKNENGDKIEYCKDFFHTFTDKEVIGRIYNGSDIESELDLYGEKLGIDMEQYRSHKSEINRNFQKYKTTEDEFFKSYYSAVMKSCYKTHEEVLNALSYNRKTLDVDYNMIESLSDEAQNNALDILLETNEKYSDYKAEYNNAVVVSDLKSLRFESINTFKDAIFMKYKDILDLDKNKFDLLRDKNKAIISLMENPGNSIEEIRKNFNKTVDNILKKEKNENSKVPGGGGSAGGASGGIGSLISTDSPKGKIFNDVPGTHWAYPYIEKARNLGIISGDDKGNFNPNGFIRRSEVSKIISKTFDIVNSSEKVHFKDVPADFWAYDYIESLYSAGLIKGVSDNYFLPFDNIKRQDMAVLIGRLCTYKNIPLESDGKIQFKDESRISDYAKDYVYALSSNKIISGDTNGNFNPHKYLTRSECIKMIIELYERG